MAKLSDLIPTLAQVLPMPEPTVAMYARYLREAKLISSGGRGPGAAQMTATDCARLLIAIMAADQVKEAASAVEAYWPLVMEEIDTKLGLPVDKREGWADLPEAILDILMPDGNEEQSFGETVAFLIEGVRLGTLTQAMAGMRDPYLRVEIERRFLTGKIAFQNDNAGRGYPQLALLAQFELPEGPEREQREQEDFSVGGDAMITFAVGYRTINALGALIRT
jgi:hypothetical protein